MENLVRQGETLLTLETPASSKKGGSRCKMPNGHCILVPVFTQIQSTVPSPTCPSLANFRLDQGIDIRPVCQYMLSFSV